MSTAADPLPDEPVERFAAALERLNPQGGKIGLAVSGGPDSMAMLLLAHAAIPGGFEVATVDHGLRPEAKDECALVVAACEARGIPCDVLSVQVGEGNLQARAREARYDALGEWAERRGLSAIATAHHADDQAETLLMRLNRGSGVAGLAGVRRYHQVDQCDVPIMRPLLDFRRAELAGIVETTGLAVAQDPSNRDERFDRVKIRKALADADWLDVTALARSAQHIAEADEALEFVAAQFWDQNARREGHTLIVRPHAARPVRLRLMDRAMRAFGGSPRGGELARLDSSLGVGLQANLAGVMVGLEEREDGLYLVFRPEPPRRTG